ncbi:MFS transporter [Bifidobacterium aemilianum]|uniref:MFS transporter n=1 Tax=Bifidobacterium aemilianum TaxID=2493120 RepID=A0A366KA91_9BIFI|nr:alpha/beta hydrolase-fold protein [Bifidobacterium aemilianum]RBP98519.1 MFS transporter [Bifidobacterium aemilianum]
MSFFTKIHLTSGWLPVGLYSLTAVGLLLVVILASSKSRRKPLLTQLAIGLGGFLIGYLAVWLLSDVFLVFEVSLGWAVMLAVAIGFGLAFFLLAAAVQSKGLRRIISMVTVLLVILSCALRIDQIYGEYATVASVLGISDYPNLDLEQVSPASSDVKSWKTKADQGQLPQLPDKGIIRSVTIPATESGFKARKANVYLPPAALSKTPPRLPVMIMLAGQPGSPDRFFGASNIAASLDSYARKHDGLAPIVVSPDQNGSNTHNTLCADTKVYGNAESYLTKDVTKWVKTYLPVKKSPQAWLIGGFSQGATCSTQLGPAHPDIYGHIYSASGQVAPVDHTRKRTIDRYFDGSEREYLKHVPANIMKGKAPLHQTVFTAAGDWDPKSQKDQLAIGKSARASGMSVTTIVAQDSGHDWHTVNTGLLPQIDRFCQETGLGKSTKALANYPKVRIISED